MTGKNRFGNLPASRQQSLSAYEAQTRKIVCSLFRQISSVGDTFTQHKEDLQYGALLDIQLHLVNHIVATEKRITQLRKAGTADSSKISEAQQRRRLLKLLGTTVAWILLEFDRTYVRAFSRGHDPGFMYGKVGLRLEALALTAAFQSPNCAGVLHDITNCLRTGDLTMIGPDGTRTLELKLRKSKRKMDRRERRQNRRGRIIREWYETGRSTELIPGKTARRHVAEKSDEHNWQEMSVVLKEAIDDEFGIQCVENCMLYCCFRNEQSTCAGNTVNTEFDSLVNVVPDALKQELAIQLKAFKDPHMVLGCHDRHIEGLPGMLPFTCFEIPDQYKEKLLFEEVYFCVLLDISSLRETIEQNGFSCKILEDGQLELRTEAGPMVVGENSMARILYECMSVKTFLRYVKEISNLGIQESDEGISA